MTQQIFGFRLVAPDGSESKWCFINSLEHEMRIRLNARNGAAIIFTGFADEINRWAAPRELIVEKCIFDFDPVAMAFTRGE